MKRPAISEAAFQQSVIDLAKLYGWRVAHFRPCHTNRGWRTPMQGDIGFPDLVLARDGEVIFAELKSENGKMTPDQKTWAEHLPGCYVWRPSDMDTINALLRRVVTRKG